MGMFNVKVERLDTKPAEDAGWISEKLTMWKLAEPITSPVGEEVAYVLTSTVGNETVAFAVNEEGRMDEFMFPAIDGDNDITEEALLERIGLHAEA